MNQANQEATIVAKVKELKKKHGITAVHVLEFEGKVAYLKSPSREQMKYGMSVNQNSPLDMAEHILECGWLEGDEEFKTNDDYFYGVAALVNDIVATKDVQLKKY